MSQLQNNMPNFVRRIPGTLNISSGVSSGICAFGSTNAPMLVSIMRGVAGLLGLAPRMTLLKSRETTQTSKIVEAKPQHICRCTYAKWVGTDTEGALPDCAPITSYV